MTIADNKKAFFDYFVEERYEAGIALEGWEVKAIRAGRVQIKEGYVVIRDAELFLIGAHISPLQSASTHVKPDPTRTRKLLLHAEEIKKLIGKVEQRGYTLVPLNLHYARGRVKCEIGLAKGKKLYDKRETEKDRDWQREGAAHARRPDPPRASSHRYAFGRCCFTICSADAIIVLRSPRLPGTISVLPCLARLPNADTYSSATFRLTASMPPSVRMA